VLQACKFWIMTDYHSWGPLDALALEDPQWWEDVLMFLRLRAVQRQSTPEWVEFAMQQLE